MSKNKSKLGILYYRIGTPERMYETPRLYAHTFDPKLAKKFERYRNMDFFIRRECMIEDPLLFQDNFRSTSIRICGFETKNPDPLKKRTLDVRIPCTQREEERVFLQTDKVFFEMGRTSDRFYYRMPAFLPEFRTVLSFLKVKEIHNFYLGIEKDSNAFPGKEIEESLFSGFDGFGVLEDFNMKVDQLGLFIYYYGDTLNENVKG